MSFDVSQPVSTIGATRAAANIVHVALVSDAREWNALIASAPLAHLPQSYAYGEGKHANGWDVKRARFRAGGRTVAIATVLERRIAGLRIVSRVNRGPLFFDPAPSAQTITNVYAALRHAWRGPLLLAPALEIGATASAALHAAGFRQRQQFGWHSGRISLLPTEDDIWAGLSSGFRNRARKSAKSGAELRIAEDAETYAWLLDRHVENMREKHFKAADTTLLQALRAAAPGDVTVFQLIHDGRPVAGMSVVRFGARAEYHIGWFGPEGRTLNAGNFLMWEIIRELRRRGVREFDVGGMRPGDGYTRFKRTMNPLEYRLAGEWWTI